jgi:ABC-2 type transport system ATP-binding protein
MIKITAMNYNIIEIKNLSKYYGKTRGIEEINLDIVKGEIFGFIGPNGAGKSTTIRILLSLIFPTSGSARIMDMDVIKESRKIKFQIGYVPSDANFYDKMDVQEFLQYCIRFYECKNSEERIKELSERFELDLGRNLSQLSMGNKKKVSIIQSLIHNPKLLILDEPTTGLDPLMQARFFDLLREENRNGLTIFFSSHNLAEIQAICKRVSIIKEGRIIKVEEIESLRQKQLKKVQIDFGENPEYRNFNINGMGTVAAQPGNVLSFMFSGNINELIHILASRKVEKLIIEEPSLEEIFMHYYR